jgi:hypothetical protein
VQLTQVSPPDVRETLKDWMASALPGTVTGTSEISDVAKMKRWMAATFPDKPIPHDLPMESAFGVFLDGGLPPADAILMPPSLTREFAHLHPDGSLHLALSREDQEELLAAGWGERHPLHGQQVNVVMLYGPRTTEEVRVAKTVVLAAYRYATGHDRVSP